MWSKGKPIDCQPASKKHSRGLCELAARHLSPDPHSPTHAPPGTANTIVGYANCKPTAAIITNVIIITHQCCLVKAVCCGPLLHSLRVTHSHTHNLVNTSSLQRSSLVLVAQHGRVPAAMGRREEEAAQVDSEGEAGSGTRGRRR